MGPGKAPLRWGRDRIRCSRERQSLKPTGAAKGREVGSRGENSPQFRPDATEKGTHAKAM